MYSVKKREQSTKPPLHACYFSGTANDKVVTAEFYFWHFNFVHRVAQLSAILTDWVNLGRHLLGRKATVRVVNVSISTRAIATVVLRLGRVHLGPSEFARISHFYFCCNLL